MKKSIVLLLHSGYWLMYLFVMTLFLALLNMGKGPFPFSSLGHHLFFTPFGMASLLPGLIGFYASYAFVFSTYLTPKKMGRFVLAELVVALAASIITQLVMYVALRGGGVNWCLSTCVPMGFFLAFIALVNGVLGLVMKGFITWYGDIKLKEELNRKNYEMELSLMKAQISPHFLFNTINNIDILILKDAVKASGYLNKLSDIMRFMLYETKAEKIALVRELDYISRYIDLQKIRTSNPDYVKYAVKGEAAGRMIAPMLFIPFIENAFKYAENKKVENAVDISFTIEPESIRFTCSNSYSASGQANPEPGGLGTELIRRRLALLYPGRHTLSVKQEQDVYTVNLLLS